GGDGLGDGVDVLDRVVGEAVGEVFMPAAVQVQGPHPQILLEDPLAQREQQEAVRDGGGGIAHAADDIPAPGATSRTARLAGGPCPVHARPPTTPSAARRPDTPGAGTGRRGGIGRAPRGRCRGVPNGAAVDAPSWSPFPTSPVDSDVDRPERPAMAAVRRYVLPLLWLLVLGVIALALVKMAFFPFGADAAGEDGIVPGAELDDYALVTAESGDITASLALSG